ncbi:hypothetical protein BDN70DRAFT_911181 [Pholiota conissans]|uniref:Uncharacterized protein n=1 Tax=Pholiota conissans TaxID=109636 RepID=A0A9P6CX25_9AGAR|nr:hypothetical protein BDN70DRAFT_911181 [Pholiota conissans]
MRSLSRFRVCRMTSVMWYPCYIISSDTPFKHQCTMSDISEQPVPRRSRTWSFYVVLLFTVIPVFFSVPLAWCFAFYSIYTSKWAAYSSLWITIFFASCYEVVFAIYHYYLKCRVSGKPPFVTDELKDVRTAYMRLLKAGLVDIPNGGGELEMLLADRPTTGNVAADISIPIVQLDHHDPRAIAFRHTLRTWFCNVPFSSIRRHHAEKWLYWTMYNAMLPPPDQIPPDRKSALDEAVVLLQNRLGSEIPEGSNKDVRPMLLTVDEVNIFWRPLTFYFVVATINWCIMTIGYSNGIEYLIRTPPHWNPASSPRPIVFLHGLGLGILQYHITITSLMKNFTDRPILVPLHPQSSQNIFHRNFLEPFSRHEMADRLAELLKSFGWVEHCDIGKAQRFSEACSDFSEDELASVEAEEQSFAESAFPNQRGITMISHSNGSYIHAWMLKGYAELIGRSCFIDPVTFCSWEGDVCYNFLYRPCTTGMELIIRYFVGTELGVANLLQRHFCWTSNSLWVEEIPNARDPHKNLFVLGGKDDIINAERVKRYLTSHGVCKNLFCDPEGRHGQALISGSPALTEILRWLSEDES